MNHTCRNATCFFISALFFHKAPKTIVNVDHKYVQNAIGNHNSGDRIHVATAANIITKISEPDCTNIVSNKPIQKNIHGLSHDNNEKSISVRKFNQSFINENARNINPKLNINLLTVATFSRRDKKLIHIAPRKMSGNAITDTFKLSQIIHNAEVVIIVHIFEPRITAKAAVKESTHVHTKASTKTETTLELCKRVVINIQLPNDFVTEDVNFLSKFLNHQLENDDTACSK